MTPEERRKMFNQFMGKAKKTAADAQKAAAEAARIAKETKKTAKGYIDVGQAYIAKGVEKANETSAQIDRVVDKVVKKLGGESAVQEEAVKPPKPKQKKGHWKI